MIFRNADRAAGSVLSPPDVNNGPGLYSLRAEWKLSMQFSRISKERWSTVRAVD